MNEKKFQQEIRNAIKYFYPGCHYKKIPDPHINYNEESYRPYDAFNLNGKNFVAIEYKQMKTANSFSFDDVLDHQVYNLSNVLSNFSPAYILINYRFVFSERQMKKYDTEQKKHNFSIAIRIDWFVTLRTLLKSMLNIKSISFEDYIWPLYKENSNLIIPWIKHKKNWVWDIRTIIK